MSSTPRIHAPGFPEALEWFNTPSPLTLDSLAGKVVILDFWTYCCINCMHVLPDLRYLEEKYPDTLAVIGVHSPKFPNERVGDNVRKAIERYGIRHPVAHDPQFQIWREYGIRAWPTLVVIDTKGYLVAAVSGEGKRAPLDQLVQRLTAEAERAGTLRRSAVPVNPDPQSGSQLRFPGKVHRFRDRLAVSDSGHHRVLVADLDGCILAAYGNGAAGLRDGGGIAAAFNDPQGLVAVDETLYVADTGNHALRAINLATGVVRTIAGTGEQGKYPGRYFADPLKAPLNSPWDLVFQNGQLFVAMAGPHQVWSMDLVRGTVGVFAGTGREALLDGPLEQSAFAQPSGLTLGDDQLYVADSEISAIRRIDLRSRSVATLVGKGLFEFGDIDGVGTDARLQHPLGVAFDPKRRCLWIADTYNHKIKCLEILSGGISSHVLPLELAEPGGICVQSEVLWVADTNHHRVILVNLETGAADNVDIHD